MTAEAFWSWNVRAVNETLMARDFLKRKFDIKVKSRWFKNWYSYFIRPTFTYSNLESLKGNKSERVELCLTSVNPLMNTVYKNIPAIFYVPELDDIMRINQ